MKSIGKLLEEMGFNANAPLETQKAFFKHLVQDAESKQLKRQKIPKTEKKEQSAQMEFDLGGDKKVSQTNIEKHTVKI